MEARPVTTTSRVGEDMVVSSGLQAGETVVTEGQLRLQPGSRVQMRQAGGAPVRQAGAAVAGEGAGDAS